MQQAIVNAYVLWAISEADVSAGKAQRTQRELAAELNRLKKEALQSSDPYLLALSAATLMNTGDRETGVRLLQQLSGLQGEDGSLNGETTVTSSGGISKQVETTALSILAWSKSAEYNTQARKAAKWLTANRQGNGGFGSTQATVLALKAMIAIANNSSRTGDKLRIKIGDTTVSEIDLPSDPRGGDSILVSGLGDHFDIGDAGGEDPTIQLSVDSPLSYTIDVGYHDLAPKNNDSCPLRISTELVDASRKGKVTAGQVTKVRSVIENTSERGLPMTVASIGLPGGLEPNVAQLDQLREEGLVDYYEIRGRQVVFYWRTVAPGESKQIDFTTTAAIPGSYTGPASQTYLYYTAEQKQWCEPLKVRIDRAKK